MSKNSIRINEYKILDLQYQIFLGKNLKHVKLG